MVGIDTKFTEQFKGKQSIFFKHSSTEIFDPIPVKEVKSDTQLILFRPVEDKLLNHIKKGVNFSIIPHMVLKF